MADETQSFIIRLLTDAAATARTKADIDATKSKLKDLEGYATQTGKRLGEIQRLAELDKVAADMGKLVKNAKDADEQAVKLAQHLKDIKATPLEVDRATSVFANTAAASQESLNVGRIGTAIRNLPSTPLGVGGLTTDAVGNLLRTGQAVKTLAQNSDVLKQKALEAAKAIGVGGFGAVAGLAALAVAINLVQAAEEAARQAARAELDARAAALKLLVEGDQAQIQSRLNTLAKEREIREAQAADAQRILDGLTGGIRSNFGIVGSAVSELDGRVKGARENATAAADALKQSNLEYELLAKQTGLTAQTTEQAAEAEKRLNLERGYASRLQADAAQALELLNLSATGTAKQVEDLIASKEREIQVYTTFKKIVDDDLAVLDQQSEAYKSAKQASDYFGDAIKRDTSALTQLTNITLDHAKANDAAAASVKAQQEAQSDLEKIGKDIVSATKKRDTELQSITAKTADAYDQLGEAFKRAGIDSLARAAFEDAKRIRTERDKDIKDSLEAGFKREDINTKLADNLVQIELDKQETLLKIARDFAYAEKGAVQDRNAVALDAAMRQRSQQETDEKAQASKDAKSAQAQRDKSLSELQKDIERKAYEEGLARAADRRETTAARDFDTAQRRTKYRRDQDDLAAANRAQILAANNGFKQSLNDQYAYIGERIKTDRAYYGDVLSYATKVQSEIAKVLNSGSVSKTVAGLQPATKIPGTPVLPSGRLTPTPFDTGGFTPTGGLAYLHPGELVLNAQQVRGLNMSPTFILSGMNKQAVRREFNQQLDEFLGKVGW